MKKRYKKLLEKSVSAMISAIEIYNKPDFKYREESFVILLVNGWELLLKAKILKENNNRLNSLYLKGPVINKKGEKTNKKEYVKNRIGINKTHDLFNCMKFIEKYGFNLDVICRENIEAMVEIRDNAIHFCNTNKLLNKKIQELGSASLKNYVTLIKDWFNESLENFNFYLMPLSFFNDLGEVDGVGLSSKNKEVDYITKYLANKEKLNPFDESQKYALSVQFKINLSKSDTEGLAKVVLSRGVDAIKIQITEEERSVKYPLDNTSLRTIIKQRSPEIKFDKAYNQIKSELEQNQNICFVRYLNPKTKKSSMKFYSENFVNLLIDKYNKQ